MLTYSIRTSSRSRHVRLSVSRDSGVVIVVPSGFDTSRIPEIIAKKEGWIKRSIEKAQSIGTALEIPTRIEFQSIGCSFNVVIEHNSNHKNYLIEDHDALRLGLDPRNKKVPFTLLKKWLRQKAVAMLLPWLEKVSNEHGFTYNRAAIRSQRTRWGSCSPRKNINLNQALVFLRPELAEYLMIHELCHTVELNHSKRFWDLVGKHCQGYRVLDKELKSAKGHVDRWVY